MLATVARYFDPWEAHIIKGRLVAEGIPATVVGDQHIIANWPWGVALGGVQLLVPQDHVEHATQVIAAYHSGDIERDLEAVHPEATSRCPACNAESPIRQTSLWRASLAFLTLLWTAVIFPASSPRLRCKACGHVWQDAE